jgi:hypothetical protein
LQRGNEVHRILEWLLVRLHVLLPVIVCGAAAG